MYGENELKYYKNNFLFIRSNGLQGIRSLRIRYPVQDIGGFRNGHTFIKIYMPEETVYTITYRYEQI